MTVRVERLPPEVAPPAGPFPTALRQGAGAAAGFLPSLPTEEAGWDAALRQAREASPRVPAAMVERIVRRQRLLEAGPRAEANARRLGEPGALTVVTGQQPGLLGGLLLAFHKAAGAIHLAAALDERDGDRVIPVFWIASEDHDLDEANRLFLLDRQGQSRRLALDLEADGRSLMHRTPPHEVSQALLEAAAAVLPDTERARDALALVAPPEGADLGRWGATAMARLLGDVGLVFLDPEDLLPEAGEALARLALDAEAIGHALRDTGAKLEAADLPAPLDVGDDYVPLFVRAEAGGPRERVLRDARGSLRTRGGEALGTPSELAIRVRARPELAGGDVVGRVFVQDRLLPVLAYVGGPTELAYHAQVRAAHDAVGLRYPLAVPRPAATWVDPKSARAAAAFGTSVEALLATEALDAGPPEAPADAGLADALEAWQRRVLAPPDALTEWATGSREREVALERARGRLEDALGKTTRALRALSERERGAGAARWDRLTTLLRPRGRPQERGLSALSVVARYGPEALREGLLGLDALASGHHVVHAG